MICNVPSGSESSAMLNAEMNATRATGSDISALALVVAGSCAACLLFTRPVGAVDLVSVGITGIAGNSSSNGDPWYHDPDYTDRTVNLLR